GGELPPVDGHRAHGGRVRLAAAAALHAAGGRSRLGGGGGDLVGRAAPPSDSGTHGRAVLRQEAAVHRARGAHGHAHPLRQPHGGGGGPHRQRGGGAREVRLAGDRRGLRHRHHLRRGQRGGGVHGRHHHAGHHHLGRGALRPRLAALPGGRAQTHRAGGEEHRRR